MLKLEKMQVSGFKSFSDRTEIRFPDGITAVVGPNGCGKSNLGDALNWVLGEQSPKNLRGKQMVDVIFNGSRGKKPKGLAEVSLYLKNDDANLPADRQQVVLTRKLFRSGESEYFLNGSRSRLKVIQEILRDEHVGAKTYATIEQGRIDQILNAKPKERRLIIEDAAGISGIKHKRRLAELKLESTHANLLRVNDIIVEVSRQINSLKRQAAKARRYQRLREELRLKERTLFGHRTREMDRRLGDIKDREAAARDQEVAAAAGLSRAEAALSEGRHALEEADRAFRLAAEALHQLDMEIDREESAIRHARDRISEADATAAQADEEAGRLTGRQEEIRARADEHRVVVEQGAREIEVLRERLAAIQSELTGLADRRSRGREEHEQLRKDLFGAMNQGAEFRNRKRSLEESLTRNGAERAVLDGELLRASDDHSRLTAESRDLAREARDHRESLAHLTSEQADREDRLATIRERLASGMENLAACRAEAQSAQTRLRTLEDVSTRFAGVSDGVRMLLTTGAAAGMKTHGVIADYVEAGQEIEAAAEVYLQGVLPAVILEDSGDARQAVNLLRREGAGRTTFLCRSQPVGGTAVGTPANGSSPVPVEILEDPRVVGRLKHQIRLNTAMNGVVRDRIGDAVVVDSLETALELHARFPGSDYLTREGEVVYASGLVAAGGAASAENGLLAHNRQAHETRDSLERIQSDVARLEVQVGADRDESRALEAQVLEGRQVLEQAGRRKVELDLREQRAVEEEQKSSRQSDVLKSELANLLLAAEQLQAELAEMAGLVHEAEQSHADLEARMKNRAEDLLALEAVLADRNETAAQHRAELAARGQQQASSDLEQQRLDESLADLGARINGRRAEAEKARIRSAEARELVRVTEATLAEHLAERAGRDQAVKAMESSIAERRQVLSGSEGGLHRLKSELDRLREITRMAEMERTKVESDRRHLDELCRTELGCSAAEALEMLEQEEQRMTDEAGESEAVPLDLAKLGGEVDDLRDRIEKIGPVNMMAIEEFSELEERHTFLSTQKEDLSRSMASLQETIKKINRTSRERFATAFEAIRKNYQEIFAVLFNGGRADLHLEEGEDVLESGIEILAQPPGKRLGSINLMSGGEKAMSAIALLFAIFRFQPSPFCLLDEVDAALDDANVGRFTRMVAEYAEQTQFILVTHNKVSMESANLLYGVTMEEPGVSKLISLQMT